MNDLATLVLRLSDQLRVWKGAPFGLRNGQDFMMGEGLPETRIDTFV
jgi:hypothetical protein